MSNEDDPETDSQQDGTEEDDDDDDFPGVVLGRLADLGSMVPETLAKTYASRPVWFFLQMDKELTTLFEQLPEDPMPKGKVDAIMAVLRKFAEDKNEDLQQVLGVTDALEIGFHVDASIERVRDAFENDGFVVVGLVEGGKIRALEIEP